MYARIVGAPCRMAGVVVLGLMALAAGCDAVAADAAPDLLACWAFDVPDPATAGADNAALDAAPRKRGVFGEALHLEGQHALSVPALGIAALNGLTLSVWCRPTDLSGFREILRQENEHRLLFSFQNGGSILSLGLNIGGYVECDAPIESAALLDGAWHHCAAIYDGAAMRIYLDGREVGALARTGAIALETGTPMFIGSSNGQNEHFQGRLDELCLYARALSNDEIAALHQSGRQELEERSRVLDARVEQRYRRGADFAETLAALRKEESQTSQLKDEEYAEAVVARLARDFPEEHAAFTRYCEASPLAYMMTPGNLFHHKRIGRLMELLVEYKPITDAQWARVSEEERNRWRRLDELAARYDGLRQAGGDAACSPEWIRLALEAGAHIQERPRVHEPVAPYVAPATPETRTRSAEEARRLVEQDWRHQAGNAFGKHDIYKEIQWARALAARLEKQHPDQVDFTALRAELKACEQAASAQEKDDESLYFRVRALKREILFSNPLLDFNRILLVDMPFPQGSEWPHETRHRLGYMAVPGAKLVVLEGLRPDGHARQLMPQAPLHGSFWRPDVSYDGQRAVVCFKPHNEKSFHLYEIQLDGSGLTQLTDGPYDDLDPIYLPDPAHILFSTTRGHTYVRCMPPTNAFVLARYNRDAKDVSLISANNEPDYLPSVLHDGRVVYTRWEYTDKPLWRAQSLWTVNPDGSQSNTLWGNQSVWPDLLKDARAIPGSDRIMFTGSAHHDWFSGSVGIINPNAGMNFPDGLTKVTADVEWPESGNGPVDPVESEAYHPAGNYRGYYSPYPLSESDFLVSAQRGDKFVLYLMDVDGNRELVYEGDNHILHAMPVRPRPVPPIQAERAHTATATENGNAPNQGVIYSANVYQGAPDALRGKARYLRILSIDHKTYTYWYKRPYISTGPVVSAVQSEGVKRILGTVPIAEDGSVMFHAPVGIPLHFQLLDEQQRALQTMRSFVNVMPGENRGCLGCHESHSRAPEAQSLGAGLMRAPDAIAPPPWRDNTVSWARYVRPVLDQYCAACHEGDGEARQVFDTTERPGEHGFTEPYWTIIGKPTWGAPYQMPESPPPGLGIAGQIMVEAYDTRDPRAYATPEPMSALSYRSRLVELAASGAHYGVQVDEISRLRLIAWVDAMAPYLGEDEIRQIPDPEFQGIDWLAVRPRIQTAPSITRPGAMPAMLPSAAE